MPRGRLRVYLGVAPGVGVTHALLDEAHRRAERGADVVIGACDDRGRPGLVELRAGLGIIGTGPGLDRDAVIRRAPGVVIVDDLAADHPPRWQQVDALLAAGIDVLASTHVTTIDSLSDVVTTLTGQAPPGAVPDSFLYAADSLELVDMAPQALRRRLAHGGLYPPQDVDAQRAVSYQLPVLAALRELALTWMSGAVVGQHARALATANRDQATPRAPTPRVLTPRAPAPRAPTPLPPADVRERVVVALSDGPAGAAVLRRGARLVARSAGAQLHAVHVVSGRDLPTQEQPDLPALRALTASVGGQYHQVTGEAVAAAILEVARAEGATQIVVGAAPPPRWLGRWARRLSWSGATVPAQLLATAGDIDVHVVSSVPAGPTPTPWLAENHLSGWRRWLGFTLAVALPALVAIGLLAAGTSLGLAAASLLLLLTVVVAALVGGIWPALTSSLVASGLLNFYFIPPVHTFRVGEQHNLLTLVAFVLVGVLVSTVVHRAAALTQRAARASAHSQTLTAIAGATLRGTEALPSLVEQLRSSFGMTSASLLADRTGPDSTAARAASPPDGATEGHQPSADHSMGGAPGGGGGAPSSTGWSLLVGCGPFPPEHPDGADVQVPAGPGLVLALSGRGLAASDRTILRACAAQVQGVLERDRLARGAALADRLEASERLRDALLAAVGHDLRSPLASATAAVSGLRSVDVDWSRQERQELLDTAEASLHRLSRLVADLLDLSRLRAGVLTVTPQPVWLDDVLPPALDELGPPARAVSIRWPDELPPVSADPALLTRALVNILSNALRYAPSDDPPLVTGSVAGRVVQLRIIDAGPGVPADDLPRIFTPFQRLGDTDNRTGLGLGLALSRGLIDAMGGSLTAEDTPGGGLTMVVTLAEYELPAADLSIQPGHRERKVAP